MQKMAEFYAFRIIDGLTTYAKVPTLLKPAVAQILREMGFEHLIVE